MWPFRKSPLVLGLKFGHIALHQFDAFLELLFLSVIHYLHSR